MFGPFRPDVELLAEYDEIAGSDGDIEPPPDGLIAREWLQQRCIGAGTLVGDYVDIGHHQTLAELRRMLAGRVVHYGITDLDASTIRLSSPRAFTQEISRHVFDESRAGTRRRNGISYRSRHGDDLENWAIFEPADPHPTDLAPITADDPDLIAALILHHLQMT